MASQDDVRAGQPEALGIIQQAAMATVAPVETKGTSPRYLEVPAGSVVSMGQSPRRWNRLDKRVGGVGGVKAFLVAPASPRHQQSFHTTASFVCDSSSLLRSSFEAVASVTNIIFVTPPRGRFDHIVAARDAKRLKYRVRQQS